MRERDKQDYRKQCRLHLICGLFTLATLIVVALLRVTTGTLPGGFAFSVVSGPLVYALFLHGFIAFRAMQQDPWVFEESIRVGVLLLGALPFGTVAGLFILADTWMAPAGIGRKPRDVSLGDGWPQQKDEASGNGQH